MTKEVEDGDYVIGTRWQDGNPGDPWAVGWVEKLPFLIRDTKSRWYVKDKKGTDLNGLYRRVKKISAERGDFLIRNADYIEAQKRYSVWYFVRCNMDEWQKFIDEFRCDIAKARNRSGNNKPNEIMTAVW